ncbi:acetylornithine transaminase [Enterococcus ureilyticus]|uniref:Acetylornithine aminotransferase n=1 Tax=Enterococcus ureilyticus TaxID=1131292 RepID=A0A1E5HGV4_9ENTE|nr:acetylornithine transaminase [Enterococcus ureilyticus]MBM7688084.1 acetylornithine aminotransferase [Enterococcus ureilyticus]OEG23850.1 acetylornithine transaminase [Enterococcus ureilyticus]
MSYLFPNYQRKAIELLKGAGNTLTDKEGKNYLDFTSGIGVMNLGYNDPELNQALSDQANLIWHTPNLYENHLQEITAKKLANGKKYISYFCNSGAEANEAAIKLARKATGKSKIITFTNSFHGRTYGAMSATGQASIHTGFTPLVPDFIYVPFNQLTPLESAIDHQTAAVMLELIQGEGGVLPADLIWIQSVQALCQEYGALLIIDEIQTGIGRTGTFYAYEQYQIEPDIFTLAKGLGNGIPVGAMVGKTKLASFFGPGSHGSTFGGNKLAMSVASKVIDRINQPDFLEEVQAKGEALLIGLNEIAKNNLLIEAVRGKGLMLGLVFSDQEVLKQAMEQLEAEGLLTLKAGQTVLRLLPPLTITYEEINQALLIVEKVIDNLKAQKKDKN